MGSGFTPPSTKKPASVRGHKPMSSISQRQIAPSESDFDDGASVADSSERIEYFKNQPECGSLEANRAKCLRCDKYVALGKQTSYNVRPWEKHRAKCDLKPAVEHQASPEGNEESRPETAVTHRKNKTEDERKSILLADPNAQEVKTDQVLCKKCHSWIRLHTAGGVRAYDLGNWKQHSKKHGTTIPSSRVATAQRKLELVNDPRVKSFSPTHVVYMHDVDYNLTLWQEHKAGCSELDSRSNRSDKFNQRHASCKAPTSVGSTSTVVSPEGPATKGVKRRLEDSEVDLPPDDPDARPQNRPRTEDYVAPDKEPPSVLGWFMMPFKSFVRGFKESMSKDASVSGS
ncbi:hypothetical protein BT96DRAFT_921818 [Gymnopus androsaceus JB14]|uniref:Uncharacterized protein n=1 Tax=Gymnopus androsaceus JB14 TaxID=1447944 RepID=A0A6A4HEM0_9AGAR|nr:hypothetical protein BT96DRAFT_921818 [Gymnopus androsaceus JB14]